MIDEHSGIEIPEDWRLKRTWGPEPKLERVFKYKDRKHLKPCSPLGRYVIAGPCSVESRDQILEVAEFVSKTATHLRGGIYRAGTYPGSHYGLIDRDLIDAYFAAAKKYGLKTVVDILDYEKMSEVNVLARADAWQIGARAMQNYSLINNLAEDLCTEMDSDVHKEIFLKRHPGSTLFEWLGAAERILKHYFADLPILLIERGSSTHMNHVRWDLSVSAIAYIKKYTNIPVIVDAAHGSGRSDLVIPLTKAGLAAGADGFLMEVHPDPRNSLSDAEQALSFDEYQQFVNHLLS